MADSSRRQKHVERARIVLLIADGVGTLTIMRWVGCKRGAFRSIVDLQAAINRFIADHNAQPQPFVWTSDPDVILGKIDRETQALASVH